MKIRKNIMVGLMAAMVGIFLLPSCASVLAALSTPTTDSSTNSNKKSTTTTKTGTSKSSGSTSKGRK